MEITLRDYQQDAVNKLRASYGSGHKSPLFVLPTGGGKTYIFCYIASSAVQRGSNVLILVHRQELLRQCSKSLSSIGIPHGFISAGHTMNSTQKVQIASVQTLVNRMDKITWKPDFIIIDECFPQGTKILTNYGEKELEMLRCGDIVASYNHQRGKVEFKKVIQLFKSKPKSMCKVVFCNGQEIFCTVGHPFYVQSKGKYVEAQRLSKNDVVLSSMPERSSPRKKRQAQGLYLQKTRQSILFRQMHQKSNVGKIFCNNGKNKQEVCKRTDEKKQSYAKPCFKGKNVFTLERNRALSKGSLWKWKWINSSTTTYAFSLKRFRALRRISHPYKNRKGEWISDLLQSRYCLTSIYVGYRNRRWISWIVKQERRRQKKRHPFTELRVESVTIQKQGSEHEFRNVCPDGYVYNIEVEDNNNYFANGILVHNCHHATAGTWLRTIKKYPDAKILGVTATPCRMDGAGLGNVFDDIVIGSDITTLVDKGYLVPADVYAPPINLDLKGVRTSMGDYNRKQLSDRVEKPSITGDVVNHYKKICNGQPALCFCVSVKHAMHMAQSFRASGIPAESIDGKLDSAERARRINALSTGEIQVLTSCDIVSEGTDIPVVTVAILLRPTKSLSLYLQQVGRVLRPSYGKNNAIILDHVGNIKRHGFHDEVREWSLDGIDKKKRDKNEVPEPFTCPECFRQMRKPVPESCPYCGIQLEKIKKQDIEIAEGELLKISKEQRKIMMEQRRKQNREADTYNELVALGKQRGYQYPHAWAKHELSRRKPFTWRKHERT